MFLALAPLLALSLLIEGCASSSGRASIPKPGSGIAEYRKVALDAHRSVAATVKSLEALAQPGRKPGVPHPALPAFDRACGKLEVTSMTARAKAEAIIARGVAYFDEWHEQLADAKDAAAAQTGTENYARLVQRFESVRQRSSGVRENFRPFMSGLREFRARLDAPPGSPAPTPSAAELESLIAGGRRVLDALDSVTTALNDAETELRNVQTQAR